MHFKEIFIGGVEQKRRSFLFSLGGLGISQVLLQTTIAAQAKEPKGYVLGATEGEHLVHFRDHGNIYIKVSSVTGSDNFAIGTQQVTRGAAIPVHRHLRMDEAFYILEGSGTCMLDDVAHSIEQGGVIFIPKTPGIDLITAIANCSCSGLCHPPAWTVFSAKPAIHPVCR